MTFKKLRYNLIMIGLVALVIAYLALSFFLTQPTQTTDNQANSSEQYVDPSIPPEPDDPGLDEEPAPGAKVPTKGIPLVVYALDILNNGEGYVSTYSSVLTNTALKVNMSVTQKVSGTISKGVNSAGEKVASEELYYHADNVPSVAADQVAFYFRGYYTNFDKGTTQIGQTTNYSLTNRTYDLTGQRNEVVPTAQAVSEFKVLESLGYPINVTAKTVSLVWEKVDPANANYRIIKVKLRSMSNLSQNFKDNYGSSGAMKNIEYQSVEMEFKINVKNGYLKSVTRYEKLTSQAVGFDVASNVTVTQTFSSMNKAATLREGL